MARPRTYDKAVIAAGFAHHSVLTVVAEAHEYDLREVTDAATGAYQVGRGVMNFVEGSAEAEWEGAKWAGNKAVEGAKWAGNKAAEGAKWAGNKAAEGAQWAGSKASEVGSAIGGSLEKAWDWVNSK